MITLRQAGSDAEFDTARLLLREYAAYLNSSVGEEHICLKEYEQEVAGLPGVYAAPRGTILLAWSGNRAAGCILLKPLVESIGRARSVTDPGESACEMKRLWVRPEFRGLGVGMTLAVKLIEYARQQNYGAMYLDTVPSAMQSANAIYRKLGFVPVERYTVNPVLGANPEVAVEYFRLNLLEASLRGSGKNQVAQ